MMIRFGKNILYFCRIWARQGPVGSLQHYCASVGLCVCVYSLHKCMSFKQQFEWRLHVTNRPNSKASPVLSSRPVLSSPVVVAHSLPAGFYRESSCASPLFTRSRSDQLGCGRPLCAGSFESFRLFAQAHESCVPGLPFGVLHARQV